MSTDTTTEEVESLEPQDEIYDFLEFALESLETSTDATVEVESLEPQNKIYDSYSEFLKYKENTARIAIKDIKESLKFHWAVPESNKATSSLDVINIPEKFDRSDCQAAYLNYLQGKKLPIEATTIKLQNGLLEACEQAYRIRHLSLPRALSMGAMSNKRWANGFMQILLLKHIDSIHKLATEDYKSKFGSN